MPKGHRRSRRQTVAGWPIAAAALGIGLVGALSICLTLGQVFGSGSPYREADAAAERAARVLSEGSAPLLARRTAAKTNEARKSDRLLALAASPQGITWRYLVRDVIESAPIEDRPLMAARVTPPPPLEEAVRSDAPAFINQRVASLSPNAPFGMASVQSGETELIGFKNSAFPYDGTNPRSQSGRYTGGRYGDNRVLTHIPRGFDIRKPGVIVVFFHGHGATLARDVRDRQQLPRQITESGVNAVLLAPQLAFDAADSSAGKFWERGGLKRFLDEGAARLADLTGNPRAKEAFERMPVILVGYSGGFVSTAWSLYVGGLGNRIRGVVLLDALYGETDKFASWIMDHRSGFFVSAYTHYTARHDDDFARMLQNKGIKVVRELRGPLKPGTVAFLPTSGLTHRDFVNRAWAANPVSDILVRMAQRGEGGGV